MWTIQFYVALVGAAALIVALEVKHKSIPHASKNDDFYQFQKKYLIVYFLAVFADWLQGPYLYRLYEEYGYLPEQIAALYMAGYVAAMISGPLLGGLADTHGRKKLTLIFCGLYSLCCVCKLSSSFLALLLGRLLGGLSTALLMSTFESWMIFEHKKQGFPSDWLPRTFALATYGNGVVAVLAGVLANLVADSGGGHHPVRPFVLAIVVLAATALAISNTWVENTPAEGTDDDEDPANGGCISSLRPVVRTRKIWLLGAVQALFEAAMYTFVFLWTPSLDDAEARENEGDHPPLGIIFASFMLAMMLGSNLFRVALAQEWAVVECLHVGLVIAAAALFVSCVIINNAFLLFLCFFVFELACGIIFPGMATLRGEIIPESDRAGIMGWFRVPLNIMVVVLMFASRIFSKRILLMACSVMCILAVVAHRQLTAILARDKLSELEEAGQGVQPQSKAVEPGAEDQTAGDDVIAV